ncbi:glycosyltransferase family 47 protein [Nocardioides sp. TRM66260-LWL]|uniref:exostosin domain-containing protein n=1 Tax=Nocardioides sp. TRM66260-LWL TaxID=2874478 RepID=UPI001CC65E81|nr:exostosin family protein [Nocardioides sp. TRM66260-LWL]MBZ5734899.1 glycosyltransferase family 47 protein [Nocardioides sp. TRM66260-LWL]
MPLHPEHPEGLNCHAWWTREIGAAPRDGRPAVEITEVAVDADAILLLDNHATMFGERAVRHPLRRLHPDKAFLYHDGDHVMPLVPGLYPSLRASEATVQNALAAPYFARLDQHEQVRAAGYDEDVERSLLFSFAGAVNCDVRARMFEALAGDARGRLVDSTGSDGWRLSGAERVDYQRRFADLVRRSRFVLAPRGIGPSTYRLYEAMEMGRPAVVLSDDWTPPPFIDWEAFLVRVPESRVAEVPRLIEDLDDLAMGAAARREWERWCGGSGAVDWLAAAVDRLLDGSSARRPARSAYGRLLRAPERRTEYVRHCARTVRRRFERSE